jgi:hypothetical protein
MLFMFNKMNHYTKLARTGISEADEIIIFSLFM